jgi:hypothetical protein
MLLLMGFPFLGLGVDSSDVGKVVVHAVVEFENVEHHRVVGALEVAGGDVDAGDQSGSDAGVSSVEGEYGCQGKGFNSRLSAEVVGDPDPQQGCGQGPAVGDLVQRGLEAVVEQERSGEFGQAAARVAGPVDEFGADVGQDCDPVLAHGGSPFCVVMGAPVSAGGAANRLRVGVQPRRGRRG